MRIVFTLLSLVTIVSFGSAQWKPAAVPLMTKWGKSVHPQKMPWKEYPRPQMIRDQWLNLNGLWDYAITPKDAPKPEKWDGQILVPFCAESALSGVGRHPTEKEVLWYRRTFILNDKNWFRAKVLLHFEAVDWETTVWVNGKPMPADQGGPHRGGFDPFSYEIAPLLKNGENEIVVRVWDPTDKGSQPLGKQISNPHGIWYTPVSGIWQTVWLEPVFPGYIRSLNIVPDFDKKEVVVTVFAPKSADGPGGVILGRGLATSDEKRLAVGKINQPIRLKATDVPEWTPDRPHLENLDVAVYHDKSDIPGYPDVVHTYYAMRKVSMGRADDGFLRLMLNNKPLFQLGPLDQGWWPDGLLTPPSDEAMRYDLEVLKKLGMNMVRKHIKVEPARYYYHCDRLGMLVWQDMPSAINRTKKHFIPPGGKNDADDQFTAEEKAQFRLELRRMIDHLRQFPCIYCWVPFNEGWGQHDTNAILKWVKEYDPSRLVDGPSGWEDRGYGDMKDLHVYPGPGMFPVMTDRVSVLGEFGGLGLPLTGHLWKDQGNWGYRTYKTKEELQTHYNGLMRQLHPLIGKGLSAAVYTQTTDVEIEVNGLLTYDREILKVDAEETARRHKALFGPAPIVRELVATSEKTAQPWTYVTKKPADGWEKPEFSATGWSTGNGGFGTRMTPGSVVRTEWNTNDIWLRRTFDLTDDLVGEPSLRIHHDEDAEIYINGVLAVKVGGYVTHYVEVDISAEARKALRKGKNTLAVHCRQTGGGQYIDVGLAVTLTPKPR